LVAAVGFNQSLIRLERISFETEARFCKSEIFFLKCCKYFFLSKFHFLN
jgi:hypothetical protein